MKYKHLLFDADNTLLDFSASEKIAFEQAMEDFQIPMEEGMLQTYSKINDSCWRMLERKELTKKELIVRRYKLFLEHYHLERDPEQVNEAYVEHLSKASFLLPGALELVQHLSEKSDIYIITNGIEKVQRGRFALSPITKYIKGLFISECLGSEKPEKLFFEKVFAQIPDFEKSRAVVIGDSATSDMLGAQNSQVDSIWYNPKKKENPYHVSVNYEVKTFREIEEILLEDGYDHRKN